MGKAPLHCLLHVRTGRVHDVAEVGQDRPGEFSGLGDIGVDPSVSLTHGSVSISAEKSCRSRTQNKEASGRENACQILFSAGVKTDVASAARPAAPHGCITLWPSPTDH